MRVLVASLVVLACAWGAAAACPASSISACSQCRYVTVVCKGCPRGKRTVAHCTDCKTNGRLRKGSNPPVCDCRPGFSLKTAADNSTSCELCPLGKVCKGGSAANPSSAASDCGPGLTTLITGAQSEAACLTLPGVGRVAVTGPDGKITYSAEPCRPGTYNVGSNTAACTSCGPGLTTDGAGKSSIQDCGAPAGSFMFASDAGQRCPPGTFTATFNKLSACNKCSVGTTTVGEGNIACNRALPGFFLEADGKAAPCPLNTYNDAVTDATSCQKCPAGLTTSSPGAASKDACK